MVDSLRIRKIMACYMTFFFQMSLYRVMGDFEVKRFSYLLT